LRVTKVDRERRRIGLSLKKVDSPEYAEMDWQSAMGEMPTTSETPQEAGQPLEPEVEDFDAALEAEQAESLTEASTPEDQSGEAVEMVAEEQMSGEALAQVAEIQAIVDTSDELPAGEAGPLPDMEQAEGGGQESESA
jgi:hypothetical protein